MDHFKGRRPAVYVIQVRAWRGRTGAFAGEDPGLDPHEGDLTFASRAALPDSLAAIAALEQLACLLEDAPPTAELRVFGIIFLPDADVTTLSPEVMVLEDAMLAPKARAAGASWLVLIAERGNRAAPLGFAVEPYARPLRKLPRPSRSATWLRRQRRTTGPKIAEHRETSALPEEPLESADRALGAAIRARRKALGWSQTRLADACGISYQQIQKYEAALTRVSFSRLVQIAHALDCSVADLISVLDGGHGQLKSDPEDLLQTRGLHNLVQQYRLLPPQLRAAAVEFLRAINASLTEAGAPPKRDSYQDRKLRRFSTVASRKRTR